VSEEAVGMILPDRVEPTYDMSLALHEEIVTIANEPSSLPPVESKPGAGLDPRFRTLHCWRGNRRGHMSHGVNPCEWPHVKI
jgi:hypothetical protein